ncbi:hypothetical protein F5I97DRAFT_8005 [Phlebopus sp. FC_14]|nr:hypothetical protein F5I97DRAFT_8005 [Phlebopus sp. FC_14]
MMMLFLWLLGWTATVSAHTCSRVQESNTRKFKGPTQGCIRLILDLCNNALDMCALRPFGFNACCQHGTQWENRTCRHMSASLWRWSFGCSDFALQHFCTQHVQASAMIIHSHRSEIGAPVSLRRSLQRERCMQRVHRELKTSLKEGEKYPPHRSAFGPSGLPAILVVSPPPRYEPVSSRKDHGYYAGPKVSS